MTFNPEVSAGNLLTIGGFLVALAVAWGRLSSGLQSTNRESQRRFTENGGKIDRVELMLREMLAIVPRINALEQRINALDIQIASLEAQSKELTKLSTDMTWMKMTLQAVANKLGVIPMPPV